MKRKLFLIFIICILLFQYACDVEAPAMVLAPPLALRKVTSADVTTSGPLYDAIFDMDSAREANIRLFISDPKFIGDTSAGISNMQNCAIIEFYGYNTEQGFNGYNIYVINGAPYANSVEAWEGFAAHLKFYQEAHNDRTVANPFYPVAPGTLSDPYYASIPSTQIAFSGGLTRFVVIFNRMNNYETSTFNDLALPVWVCVTAVSLTEGSLNESLPSNVIQIN